MRKLKLQMQVSIDGFASTGPDDEQKWVTWALEDIYSYVLELFDSCDTILIGRKLAIDYIPYWEDTFTKPDDPMFVFAERIVAAQKIVFTKTLSVSEWGNTILEKGDLVDAVKELKKQDGKDMIVYGGTSFVASLIKEGLIDELHFFVNPVAIGKGVGIFNELEGFQQLKLERCIPLKSGIVLMSYTLR